MDILLYIQWKEHKVSSPIESARCRVHKMRMMQKNTRENFQSPVQIHFEEKKKKNENAHKQQTNEQRLKDCQKSPNQMKNGAFK